MVVVYYCPVVIAQYTEHWQFKCKKPVISFPGFLLKRREPGNKATSDPGFNSVQSILSSFWFFTFSSSLHTIGPGA